MDKESTEIKRYLNVIARRSRGYPAYKGLKMYSKLLFVSTLFVACCFGMQHQEDSMTKINEWHEMAQFAGQIIAYQTNSSYMRSEHSYTIDNNNSIMFGKVSSGTVNFINEGNRYRLYRVLKKEAVGSICVITEKVVLAGLWARYATQEEIEKIHTVIKNKQARWF